MANDKISPEAVFAALVIVFMIVFMFKLLADSDTRASDPNFYGGKETQNLATRIYELHEDVRILQTQIAGMDSR